MPSLPSKGEVTRLWRKVTLGAEEVVGSTTGVWRNPAARAPASRGQFKVETYNVHGGKTPDAKASNFDAVAAQIRASGAGVIVLQELKPGGEGRDWAKKLAEATGMHLAWAEGQQKAILSRYPIESVRRIDFPESAQRDSSNETRGLLAATVTIGGRKVDIASAHLDIPISEPNATWANGAQIREVRKYIEARRRAGVPVVVAGDFNANFAVASRGRGADEWVSTYRQPGQRVELGTIRDPRVRREAEQLLAATRDQWEAPRRHVILSDGRRVTPEQVRLELEAGRFDLTDPKVKARYLELQNALDGVTHPGADKRFDNVFVAGLRIVESTIDYSARGSDHKPVSAVIKLDPPRR